MTTVTLDEQERDRRWKKIREGMEKRGIDCLIAYGSGTHNLNANLRYLSNVTFGKDGYMVFPLSGDPTLFLFMGRPEKLWVQDCRAGHPFYSQAISERLVELHLEKGTIGIVGLSGYYGELGFPAATYLALSQGFPNAALKDGTSIVEQARRIKSAAEIRCFEFGCEAGEKVIQTIKNTAKVGVLDNEIKTKIWDTLFLNGCDPSSMLIYSSGKDVTHAGRISIMQQKPLESGDVILTEFDARYCGYKSQFNQPFCVNKPDREWQEIFDVARGSFDNAFNILKPGITAGQLDEAFLLPIHKAGYIHVNPCYHGRGASLEQPIGSYPGQPLYKLDTSLIIESGMVIEFEPHVVRSDRKRGMSMGSPVLVTETGCRLLSKSWKPELRIT